MDNRYAAGTTVPVAMPSRALVSDKVSGWESNILNRHATRWLTLSD